MSALDAVVQGASFYDEKIKLASKVILEMALKSASCYLGVESKQMSILS